MNCLFNGIQDERPSLVGGYGIVHDWKNAHKTFSKSLLIQDELFSVYDIMFPQYFCLHVEGKLIKKRDEKEPFRKATRIVHDSSTAYLDYIDEEDEITIEFFSYEDKSKVGSGLAFKALRMLCEGFFPPKPLSGTVPHLNSRYGSYKKLLQAYQKFGFNIGKEIVFDGIKSNVIFLHTRADFLLC
ncbi:hypothetical protein N8843_07725 [Verrucomicrobia bacterium]|nr:hypothetical protein [Verrucomicrobiota bacterium]